MARKVSMLRQDISNIPSHVYGEHKKCAEIGYFCDGKRKEGEINHVPTLETAGLYSKVQGHMKRVSANATSLLADKTSNIVESFNSIIAKLVCGKRINYALKGAYPARCDAAVVTFNTRKPISRLYEALGGTPNEVVSVFEAEQLRQLTKHRARRQVALQAGVPRKALKRKAVLDADYGPQSAQPDIDEESDDAMKTNHIAMLREWKEDKNLEERTREQAESEEWLDKRRKLLTASHFGDICKRRASTKFANKVKAILYLVELTLPSLTWGVDNEDVARKEIENKLGVTINRCGLFIDPVIPYLGASPDGVMEEDGIIEIKCPYAAKESTLEEAIQANVSYLQDAKHDCKWQ